MAVLIVAPSKTQQLCLQKGGTAKSPTVGIGLPYLKRSTVYNSLCPTDILAKKQYPVWNDTHCTETHGTGISCVESVGFTTTP